MMKIWSWCGRMTEVGTVPLFCFYKSFLCFFFVFFVLFLIFHCFFCILFQLLLIRPLESIVFMSVSLFICACFSFSFFVFVCCLCCLSCAQQASVVCVCVCVVMCIQTEWSIRVCKHQRIARIFDKARTSHFVFSSQTDARGHLLGPHISPSTDTILALLCAEQKFV